MKRWMLREAARSVGLNGNEHGQESSSQCVSNQIIYSIGTRIVFYGKGV